MAGSAALPFVIGGAGAAPAPPPAVSFLKSSVTVSGTWAGKPGDFNGDGNDDVLWYAAGSTPDQVSFGRDDGTFDDQPLTINGTYKVRVADYDGDGDDDVLWYAAGTTADKLWLGQPDGEFQDVPAPDIDGTFAPSVGDFNGDGNADVFLYRAGTGADEVRLGQSDATFVTQALDVDGTHQPLVGDFEGDGDDDVFLYTAGTGTDVVLLGGPSTPLAATRAVTVNGTYRPFVGDFEGDGRSDVYWYRPGTGVDYVWYGNANGTFSQVTSVVNGTYKPVVANFNESGSDVRTDVFWYAAGATTDHVWLGTGTRGQFAKSTESRGGTVVPLVGDFDGSSSRDILWYRAGTGIDKLWRSIHRPVLTVETFVANGDVADGIGIPWDMTWTPDGSLLFDERNGDINLRLPDGTIRELVDQNGGEQPDLYAAGEGGLLGIVVDPDFATNRRFYTCQGENLGSGNYDIQVVGWEMNPQATDATRFADPLLGGLPVAPPSAGVPGRHSGCRLRFGPDGNLWIGTGDTAVGTIPQDRTSLGGKILRIDEDTGQPPPDNPYVGDSDPTTDPRVYNYGHRNVQGLALRANGQMWSVEHGSFRDDEVNLVLPGANYGWDPDPDGSGAYDESVSMTDLVKFPDAVVAARSSGNPTNAWSGAWFLSGPQWGTWDGALAIGVLKDSQLRVMFFTDDGQFVRQEIPVELDGVYGRLRSPVQGPDGSLYVTTSNGVGSNQILRVTPSL